jgi:hypothetical protein
LYLGRDIVFEDEAVPQRGLSGTALGTFFYKKLLENPLFDSRGHVFTAIPAAEALGGGLQSGLYTLFFFEKTWLREIERIFLANSLEPSFAGILSCCPDKSMVPRRGKPFLYAAWAGDLEVLLVQDGRLLFSRHVPAAADAQAAWAAVVSSMEKLRPLFPDVEKTVFLAASPERKKEMSRLAAGQGWAVADAALPSAFQQALAENDPFLLPVFFAARRQGPAVDISDRITVPASMSAGHRKWLMIAAAAFFVAGLAGFAVSRAARARLHRNMVSAVRAFAPQAEEGGGLQEMLAKAELSLSARDGKQNMRMAPVFQSLILCIPRDARWEIESFSLKDGLGRITFSFSSEQETASFVKAAQRSGAFSGLVLNPSSGTQVDLSFSAGRP